MGGASFYVNRWLTAIVPAAVGLALVAGAPSRAFAQEAELVLSKSGPASAAANTNVTYSLNLLSGGPDDATDVTVSDPLPLGMNFVSLASPAGWNCATPAVGTNGTVSCTRPLLAAGSNVSFSLTAAIPNGTPPGTVFTNIATVSSTTFDPTDENNSGIAVTIVSGGASADLIASKTAPGTVQAGQNLTYSISTGNAGPNDATSVSVSDGLPGNLTFVSLVSPAGWTCATPAVGTTGPVTCTRPTFAAGATANFTLVTNVPSATPAGTDYTNTVTISSATDDATPENNSGTAGTTVVNAAPDLAITKSHSGNAQQGQIGFVYTLGVSNVGTVQASGTTTVQDTLPPGMTATGMNGAGWTCTVATVSCTRSDTLAAGASFPSINLIVNVAANAANNLINTATVTNAGDVEPLNNVATDPTVITTVPTADLAIAKTHTGNAQQGQSGFPYTITVQNVGASSTSGTVTVTDTLPAGLAVNTIGGSGWSCNAGGNPTCFRSDVLTSGASYPPITLTVNVSSSAPATVTNTATVSGGGDTNPANDSASDPTTVTPQAVGADLAIAKTHAGDARAGQIGFTYRITVNNAGTVASAGTVTVTDLLPPKMIATAASGSGWACSLGATPTCSRSDALAPGAVYPLITLTVNIAGDAPPVLTNTATVSGGGDINTANNSASDATNVRARSDPTKDPDVVGLVNAQMATAQRFANTQISNFNERLEALHDDHTGDQFGMQFGSSEQNQCMIPGTSLPRDPFDPNCKTKTAEASANSALGYAPDRKSPIYKAEPPVRRPTWRDYAFWSTGYVSFGNADPTAQRSGIEFNTSGVSAGVDYRFGRQLIAGFGIGYGRDSTKIGDRGTRSDAEAYNAAIYGSYRPFNNFFIDGVAGYGALRFNSQRFIVDDGTFAFGSRSGNQAFASLTAAYQFRWDGLMLSPYGRINAAWVTLNAFTESGGLGGALAFSSQTAEFYTAVLGLRGKYTIPTEWGAVAPRFRVEYHHDFAGTSTIFLQYADLLSPIYSLTTTPAGRDRASVGAGTDLVIGDRHRLSADYQYDVDFLGADWHRFKLRWESRF